MVGGKAGAKHSKGIADLARKSPKVVGKYVLKSMWIGAIRTGRTIVRTTRSLFTKQGWVNIYQGVKSSLLRRAQRAKSFGNRVKNLFGGNKKKKDRRNKLGGESTKAKAPDTNQGTPQKTTSGKPKDNAPEVESTSPQSKTDTPESTTSTSKSDTPNQNKIETGFTGDKTHTHLDAPEVEPGVVAKREIIGVDGNVHEVKVNKKGQIVRCSDCGDIAAHYDAELKLPENAHLKKELESIRLESDPNIKADRAQKLAEELESFKKKKGITSEHGQEHKLTGAEPETKAKEPEFDGNNKFSDPKIEDKYQDYLKRKRDEGKIDDAFSREEWRQRSSQLKEGPSPNRKTHKDIDPNEPISKESDFGKAMEKLEDPKVIDDAYKDYLERKKKKGEEPRKKDEWYYGKLNEKTGKRQGGFQNVQKGKAAEHVADVHLESQGFTKLSDGGKVTSLDNPPRGTGLDGIWEKDGKIYITETKYNTSKLTDNQKRPEWISEQINNIKDPNLKMKVQDAMDFGQLEKRVVHVDTKGIITFKPWE